MSNFIVYEKAGSFFVLVGSVSDMQTKLSQLEGFQFSIPPTVVLPNPGQNGVPWGKNPYIPTQRSFQPASLNGAEIFVNFRFKFLSGEYTITQQQFDALNDIFSNGPDQIVEYLKSCVNGLLVKMGSTNQNFKARVLSEFIGWLSSDLNCIGKELSSQKFPFLECSFHLVPSISWAVERDIDLEKTKNEATIEFTKALLSEPHLNQKQLAERIALMKSSLDTIGQHLDGKAVDVEEMLESCTLTIQRNRALLSEQLTLDIAKLNRSSPRLLGFLFGGSRNG